MSASAQATSTNAIRGRWLLAYAAVAVSGFLLLLLLVTQRYTTNLDYAVTVAWQRNTTPGLLPLMQFVSWFGFRPQSLLVALLLIGALWWWGLRRAAVWLAGGVVLSQLNDLLKLLVHRPRPQADGTLVAYGHASNYSFPSGHVVSYLIVAGFVAYLAWTLLHPQVLRLLVTGVLCLLIVLVGPSRVYLGHHWLTDTLGGYCLGIAVLALLLVGYRATEQADSV